MDKKYFDEEDELNTTEPMGEPQTDDLVPEDAEQGEVEMFSEQPEPDENQQKVEGKGKKQKKSKKKVTGKEKFARARTIVGVVFMLVAVICGIGLVKALKKPDTTVGYVVVSLQKIDKGTLITRENWEKYIAPVPTKDGLIGSYVYPTQGSAIAAFVGKESQPGLYAKMDIKAATIMRSDWMTATQDFSDVPDGMQLVSFAVPNTTHFVGFIPSKGDVIKLYGVYNLSGDETKKSSISRQELLDDSELVSLDFDTLKVEATEYELLQYVQIYGLYNEYGEELDDQIAKFYRTHDATEEAEYKIANIVILCTKEQAKQLIVAQSQNNIYCTLVCNKDAEKAALYVEKQQRIIDRYNKIKELLNSTTEKHKMTVPLDLFVTAEDGKAPLKNDFISFSFKTTEVINGVDSDGLPTLETHIDTLYPALLQYIKIADVIEYEEEVKIEEDDDEEEYNDNPYFPYEYRDWETPKTIKKYKLIIEVEDKQEALLWQLLGDSSYELCATVYDGWDVDAVLVDATENTVKKAIIADYDAKIAEVDSRILNLRSGVGEEAEEKERAEEKADVTPEATPDTTPETTPEATPEATPAPTPDNKTSPIFPGREGE